MVWHERTADYSGRPYYLRLRVWTAENNQGGNWSTYGWELAAVSKSGNGSYAYDCFGWAVNVGGQIFTGCHSLNFGGSGSGGDWAGKTIVLGSGGTAPIGHDGNGYLNFVIGARQDNASIFGTAIIPDQWVGADRIPKPPSAPRNLRVTSTTPTNAEVQYDAPADDRGAPITGYYADWYQINGVDNPRIWHDLGGVGISSPRDGLYGPVLIPGTTYHVYVGGINSAGYGDSAGIALTTLPSSPPTIAVAPDVAGSKARVTLTAPGGVTGVTGWLYEYKPAGGAVTAITHNGNILDITGLSPGGTYQYRGAVQIGSYTSPWSDWATATQPSPNTNAGDYFDGSTPDKTDVSYAWDGAEGLSVSRADGAGVAGWRTFDAGNDASGGTGAVYRATGGLVGPFGARVVFFTDATAAGFRGGQALTGSGLTAVEPNTTYYGSVMVRPSRKQRMAAAIQWIGSAEEILGVSVGAAVVVAANAVARLQVSAIAPAGAAFAAVEWRDVTGTDWSLFQGGDVVLEDGAMIALDSYDWFSGDTTDTPQYRYEWLGTPNESQSVRYENEVVLSDPLADPDCSPIPAPPTPPAIPNECIIDVGTWRRYLISIGSWEVRKWSATIPTLILTTGAEAERQVRIRIFENPDGLPSGLVDTSEFESEMILSYIPPNTTVTLDGVTRRVRAAVGDGDPIPANQLLYGTGGTPASWPELSCGIAYLFALDVPLDAPVGNLSSRVILTQRM